MRGLVTFAAFGGAIPTPVLIAVAVLVIAVVIGLVAFFLFRGGKKQSGTAPGAGMPDWQRQQAGAGGQQNPWGQQGQQQWGPQAQQPGSQAGWGMPAAQQQPPAAGWGAQAPQQQPGGWGMPAAQQQPGGWDAAAQQPSAGWGTPAAQQQPSAAGWGAPATQQPQGWGNQNAPGMPAAQQPWGQPQSATPPPQDPWAQQQQQQQAVPAWGIQNNQQPAPSSYGAGTSGTNQGWDNSMGQTGQGAQGMAPWGQPAQQAQPGGWPGMAAPDQQQPVSPPPGSNLAQSSWQPGVYSPGQMGQPVPQAQPGFGGGFDTPDGDRTVLGPVGSRGPAAQGYSGGYVRVEEGKEPGRVYEVRKDTLTIGRSRESDIFLEDLAVSRQHASIISMGNGNYALRDEGSANGTKVNGQVVNKYQPYPLQEGDKIQLGQTVLVFARQ